MSTIEYNPNKLRTARGQTSTNHQPSSGNRMVNKVMVRKQQKVVQESLNDRRQITTRQGQSNTRSKMTLLGDEQDEFQNNEMYVKTGRVTNVNRENCLNNAQYVHQEYVRQQEAVRNQEYVQEDDYDDEESGDGYNYDPKAATEPHGENEVHLQMKKVLTDMNEEKCLARNTYNTFCEKIGTMDSKTVLQETVRRATRKFAWKNFKLLEEEDYHYSSTFAAYIFESLGIEMENITGGAERQELWLKFKKFVSEGMQAARSAATQAIKKQFIGKLMDYSTISICNNDINIRALFVPFLNKSFSRGKSTTGTCCI
jgi:hypothetical protein